jgi:hypothetical protein
MDDSTGEATGGIRMTGDTDDYSVEILGYVSGEFDTQYRLAKRKAFIYECFLKLMKRLGAIIRRLKLLYWKTVDFADYYMMMVIDVIVFRRSLNKGRHRNNILKNSRWY